MRADWHPEDIKAAIRKTGTNLSRLARENGYSDASIRVALAKPWAAVEAIIARQIGRHPSDIWPSRYDVAGLPLRRPRKPRSNGTPPITHRKLGASA